MNQYKCLCYMKNLWITELTMYGWKVCFVVVLGKSILSIIIPKPTIVIFLYTYKSQQNIHQVYILIKLTPTIENFWKASGKDPFEACYVHNFVTIILFVCLLEFWYSDSKIDIWYLLVVHSCNRLPCLRTCTFSSKLTLEWCL